MHLCHPPKAAWMSDIIQHAYPACQKQIMTERATPVMSTCYMICCFVQAQWQTVWHICPALAAARAPTDSAPQCTRAMSTGMRILLRLRISACTAAAYRFFKAAAPAPA